MTEMVDKLFCALSTTDEGEATALTAQLAEKVGGVRVGMDYLAARGAKGIRELQKAGAPAVYLDTKFYDIPSSVYRAVQAVMPMEPDYLTIHAGAGRASLAAARAAVEEAAPKKKPALIASTVLTSFDEANFGETGIAGQLVDRVYLLAVLAREAGLDGVECAAHETGLVRDVAGEDFTLVVSGVRPHWAGAMDQRRIVSPWDAARSGADIVMVGRPITDDPDPERAACRILDELVLSASS